MKEKTISPILALAFGFLLGVVFIMLALGVSVDEGGYLNFTLVTTEPPTSGDTSTTTTHETTTHIYESPATTTIQRADLREVALPYLVAFPNFQTLCVTGGGTYHETRDWVGCEGVGTPDCNTGAIIAARTQCLSVDGDFVCSPTNLYCRYS